MKRPLAWVLSLAVCGLGCGDDRIGMTGEPEVAIESPGAHPTPRPRNPGEAPAGSETAGNAGPGTGPMETPPTAPQGLLPTDDRPAVRAQRTPPPISGGTLLIARDGSTALVADPDRDRVSVVDLRRATVTGQIALEIGDEPGRLAQDAAGRVHVVLRSADSVVTFDPAALSVAERRAVCAAPRGIAYDPTADVVHVACASGELVSLPAAGGDPVRRVYVAPDLRDVIVQPEGLRVSQFRSATLLELDASGTIVGEHRPSAVTLQLMLGTELPGGEPRAFAPALARRAIAMGNGQSLVLHGRAMADTVEIPAPHAPDAMNVDRGAPGYGIGDSCQSIVQTAVSIVDASGKVRQSASLSGAILPVDVAVSAAGTMIAIANAGTRDPLAPVRGRSRMASVPIPEGVDPEIALGNGGGSVNLLSTRELVLQEGGAIGESCLFNTVPVTGQPTAVAFTPDGGLVVQSREPAQLSVVALEIRTIDLDGESRLDTGHELFHRDAGGGIACASCHGEAGDDGHVWNFSGLGPRRTQSVNVGLEGTEPFHWSGDMHDLPMLMSDVFVTRMGGIPQSEERVDALASWLFRQRPPAPIRAAHDPAAVRGRAVFESEAAACGSCHGGEKLTNNATVDVGTGGAFQVPSLVGLGYRAPFLHTGCAVSLRDRFDPACGGDEHGNTAQLSSAELDDLIAYLETL